MDITVRKTLFREMVFYRRMMDQYGKKLYLSECDEIPGTLIYDDEYQIAVKEQKEDTEIRTKELVWPIRVTTEKDILQCVSVIRESFGTVAKEFGFTQENAPRFTAFATDENRIKWHLLGEKRPMFGYFADGQLVGYYSLACQNEQEWELNNLSVLPAYRHQKIGEILVLDALSRASEMGCTMMRLGIVEENQVLRKWYEELGFTHTGTEKYDFFPFTCGYMSKDL
jgi:ribosomal protein S18 acetylase RimI-like enzyme